MNIVPYNVGDAKANKDIVEKLVTAFDSNENKHILETDGDGRYMVILFKNRSQLNDVFSFFYGNELDYSIFKSDKNSKSCLALLGKRNLSWKGGELIESLVMEASHQKK